MIKPYHRPYRQIKGLLNAADETSCQVAQKNVNLKLIEKVYDEDDERFLENRQKEYAGIFSKGVVKVVSLAHAPKNAKFVGTSFVLCVKDLSTPDQWYKARWILQAHQDKIQNNIANNSPMLMKISFRIVLSLATIFFQVKVWTRDIEKAYMQSKP